MSKIQHENQWRKSNGEWININEMDDTHLLNSHRFCHKQMNRYLEALDILAHPVFAPRGEWATDEFEKELGVLEKRYHYFFDKSVILYKEIKNRRLKALPSPKVQKLPEYELVSDDGNAQLYKLKEGGDNNGQ